MINLTKDLKFDEIVSSSKLVVFDFSQENCTRCKTLEIEISNYLKNNDVLIYSVSVENNMKLVRKLNIYASPCVLVYFNGKQVYKNLGTFSFNEVINLINELNAQ